MYIYVTFRDIFIETFILKQLKDAKNCDGLFFSLNCEAVQYALIIILLHRVGCKVLSPSP